MISELEVHILTDINNGRLTCAKDYSISDETFLRTCHKLNNDGFISGFYLMDGSDANNPNLLRKVKVTSRGMKLLNLL